MPCSSASTLTPISSVPVMPPLAGVPSSASQALKLWAQQVLAQIQAAGGATGVNAIPQQYALLAGSALPPIASVSNCTVALDATKQLFGAGSYKVSLTGSPAVLTLASDTAWPLQPGWQWMVSFFQQASAAVAGEVTITTSAGKAYSATFTTTLTAAGWDRLYDALNLIADTSAAFGLSFTFTGGSGQTVWLDGLMFSPFYGRPSVLPSFQNGSAPLLLDNNPDGFYSKILSSRTASNVAFNFRGAWVSTANYLTGDEVVYGPTYWVALAPSTNSTPTTSNANWQAVGSYSGFEGAWSSLASYPPGAEVTYGGNFWVCLIANTNSAPTTSNPNWQVAGPVNADAVPPGTSYAIPTLNTGGGENLVENGNFTLGLAGWSKTNDTSTMTLVSHALPGGQTGNALQLGNALDYQGVYANPFDLVPGATYLFSVWIASSVAASYQLRFNQNGYLSNGTIPANTWTLVQASYTVPLTAVGASAVGQFGVTGETSSAQTYLLWGASVVKVRNADNEVSDGTNWLRMPAPAAISGAATTSLSNGGTSTTITVGAGTYYLGNMVLSANAGTVNPGTYGGPFFIYFDDPGYAGGAVTYQYSTNLQDVAKGPYRFYVGQITTASGSGSGGGGGLPPCFSGDTRIRTSEGLQRFDELPEYFDIVNRTGKHAARLLVHRDSLTPMRQMGKHLVTEDHLIGVADGWVKAKLLFAERATVKPRTVYNVHVFSEREADHHYILESGLAAHNAKP